MNSSIKSYINIVVGLLFTFILSACVGGGGSGGGGGNITYGTLSFSESSITLEATKTKSVSLTLNDSSNISNMQVTFSIDSSIASVRTSSCSLSSSGNDNQCIVKIVGNAEGVTELQATASYNGHTYTVTPVNVHITPYVTGISMVTNGITQTIYTGQSYNATFTFTNNTNSPINLGQMTVSGDSKLGTTIDTTPCSNMELAVESSCQIKANNISITTPNKSFDLSFVLNGTGANAKTYTFNLDNIVAVKQVQGYAAFRITNHNNPGHKLYIVVLNKNSGGVQEFVTFESEGVGRLTPGLTYEQASMLVPNNAVGLVLYQNNFSGKAGGIGGIMYASLDRPVTANPDSAPTGPAPWNSNDPSRGIVFSQYEPNVWNNAGTGLLTAILDITDINFVGLTQTFSAMDITTGNNLSSGQLAEQYTNLTTSQVYDQIKTALSPYPNSWGISDIFLQSGNPLQWQMIFGLADWLNGNTIQTPSGKFNQNLYTEYVNDLWGYYESHTLYIDASEISAPIVPGSTCILQATVQGESMLVSPYQGACATESAGANPNTFYWSKFSPGDFVGAAGNSANTLYGANTTYRSMGKYVSAAQSVGFLPFCSEPNIVYGPNVFGKKQYVDQYWTNQYSSCLNPQGSYGDHVINQYDRVFHQYIPLNYAWGYDDVLGISSAVTIDATKSGFTLEVQKFR